MKNSTTIKLTALIGVGYGLTVLAAVRALALAYSATEKSSTQDGAGSDSTTKSRTPLTKSDIVGAGRNGASPPTGPNSLYHGLAHGKDGSCIIYITSNGELVDILAAEAPDDFNHEYARFIAHLTKPEQEENV